MCLFSAALLCPDGLLAQQIAGGLQWPGQPQPGVLSFQPAQTIAAGRTGRGIALPAPRAETGKPFSATVTTQTSQIFLDGTRVNRTTTMIEYRDAEGRVRTETLQPGSPSSEPLRTITIRDTVAGTTYRLNPADKSAVKVPMATGSSRMAQELESEVSATVEQLKVALKAQAGRSESGANTEDLGTATINGVTARGTRSTTVVPAGAIGNDREFRSVEERWFSTELNLLVKSISSDPRFGTTTYELMNISRQAPDPALFQVPADYTVKSGGRGEM
jgi:hypothetical protein